MTSAIDICNEALASIGARSVIASFTESSKEAVNCQIFYGPTRTALLRAAHWGFARKQQLLSELGNAQDSTAPYPWGYKYAYPADCERFRYLVPQPVTTTANAEVIPADAWATWPLPAPCRDWPYVIANDVDKRCLLTNVQYAIGVYTCDVQDPDLWDSLFRQAMVAAMAAKLCMNISGKVQLMQGFKQEANDAIMVARAADGNEAMPSTNHTPDWIAARGTPWGYGLAPAVLGGGLLWNQSYEQWGM
jgi:hypothetical protein